MRLSHEQIEQAIICDPNPPKLNLHGEVTLNFRMQYEADHRLAKIRKQAVDEAVNGRAPSYKG